MLSHFRVRDPETARNIAIVLESILFTRGTSGSTTPTSMNSDAIAASVGFDLVRTPVHRETVPIPTLTEEQTRQAFSVVPSDYWQHNSWTCRDCGHSTFTCPSLTSNQRISLLPRSKQGKPHDGAVSRTEDGKTSTTCERTSAVRR